MHEFTCLSGNCIASYDVCNTFKDCDDGSDELNCRNINDDFKTTIKPSAIKENKLNDYELNNELDEIADQIISNPNDYETSREESALVRYLEELENKHLKEKEKENTNLDLKDSNKFKMKEDFLDSFLKARPSSPGSQSIDLNSNQLSTTRSDNTNIKNKLIGITFIRCFDV
jgi:hypothetical protein